ncbi:MAG TPA: malate dehydrogenase [Bdellovibrionota bacterium]|nr:malate dehydrogenase [Bdellovibrionota bacterium]
MVNALKRKKITVVGAGNVGATVAQYAALKQLGDVVLVDIIEGVPQGKSLDLKEASPILGYDVNLVGSQSYEVTADSDLVVITAGIPRKPGMSRDDLLQTNTKIVKSVTEQIVRYSPNAILIVISNPLDAMVFVTREVSKFPAHRVLGMAGVLDTARFRAFLAEALNCSIRDVSAFVLGGHGDTMVPLVRYSTMAGIPIANLLPKGQIDKIVQRTRDGGAEIVALLKTGSAYYAPGAAAVEMAESILLDEKRILPCCVYLNGEYGLKDVFVGVPVKLGASGVEKIIEVTLEPTEKEALGKSAEAVRELMTKVRGML